MDATQRPIVSECASYSSMEKRRAKKCEQAAADQDGDPHAQGSAGDDLGTHRRLRVGLQSSELAKGGRSIEGEHVQSGHHHKEELEAEGVIVEILIGVADKEYDPGNHVKDIAADAPRHEAMYGSEGNTPRHA